MNRIACLRKDLVLSFGKKAITHAERHGVTKTTLMGSEVICDVCIRFKNGKPVKYWLEICEDD